MDVALRAIARFSILDPSILPHFPAVYLPAAQHPLEAQRKIAILSVGGEEDRKADVAVLGSARKEWRALAAPGRGRASYERQGDDWRSVDRAAPVRAAGKIEMRIIL